MEVDQEVKHCCNVCGKRFSNGCALGGHKKSHKLFNSSSNPKVDEDLKASSRFFKGLRVSYGLRKNPKKTQKSLSIHGRQEIEQEKKAAEILVNLSKESDQELKGSEPKKPNEGLGPLNKRKRIWKVVVSDCRCHSLEEEAAETLLMLFGNHNSSPLEGKEADQELKGSELKILNAAVKLSKKRSRNQGVVASDGDLSQANKRFICKACGNSFSSPQALGGHRGGRRRKNGCCAPRSVSAKVVWGMMLCFESRTEKNLENI